MLYCRLFALNENGHHTQSNNNAHLSPFVKDSNLFHSLSHTLYFEVGKKNCPNTNDANVEIWTNKRNYRDCANEWQNKADLLCTSTKNSIFNVAIHGLKHHNLAYWYYTHNQYSLNGKSINLHSICLTKYLLTDVNVLERMK